jgi:hypothetical protein
MCGVRPGYGTGLIVRKRYSPVDPVRKRPLPYLHKSIADWLPARIQYSAAEPGDLTQAGCRGVIDDEEVIIRIQGEMIRIKGAFGLRWGTGQFFGEQPGHGEKRAGKGHLADKSAAAG